MKKLTLIFAGFVILVTPIFSQQPGIQDSTVSKAMLKIQHLSGEWSGKGWIQMGRDKRTFAQTENVVQKANGTVIVVDGVGIDESTGKTVHEAFAIISYDQPNKKYLMRAFLANGNYIDADISVEDDGTIIWGFKHPQAGDIKYTIKASGSKWEEKGAMNRDGANWVPFFQMNLEKIK
jgi:hypothetical protein